MTDNDNVFLKKMRGVNPIKKKYRVEKTKTIIVKKKEEFKSLTILKSSKEKLEPKSRVINSNFSLEDVKIKKNIKKGFFKIDKKIDFHGNSLLESEEIFSNTIIQCYEEGLRCILFVTGKGLYKQDQDDFGNKPKLYHGVIRGAFNGWIKSNKFSKYILSYEGAGIEHGSDGAFYVYLRKKKLNSI